MQKLKNKFHGLHSHDTYMVIKKGERKKNSWEWNTS
jgi:hypothetical protein